MRNIIKEWFTEKADDKRRKVEADAELAIELAEIDAMNPEGDKFDYGFRAMRISTARLSHHIKSIPAAEHRHLLKWLIGGGMSGGAQ